MAAGRAEFRRNNQLEITRLCDERHNSDSRIRARLKPSTPKDFRSMKEISELPCAP
jgi:hypothetical protein